MYMKISVKKAMKKYSLPMLSFLCLITASSQLAGCGSKAQEESREIMPTIERTQEETNPENGLPLSKQPDPNAPVLDNIVIYVPDDKGKVSEDMYAAEELSEENIIDLLISCGTLGEGTSFVSLELQDIEDVVNTEEAKGGENDSSVKNSGAEASKAIDGSGGPGEMAKAGSGENIQGGPGENAQGEPGGSAGSNNASTSQGGNSGSKAQSNDKKGLLTLANFKAGSGLDETTAKQATADTFAINYGLSEVEVILTKG